MTWVHISEAASSVLEKVSMAMKSGDIQALAKTRAARAALVRALEAVSTSQEYQMAFSAYQEAEDQYQRAISTLTTGELVHLSKATGGEIQP